MTYNPTPSPSPWSRGGEPCAQTKIEKSGAIMVPLFSFITFIYALTSFPQDSATGSPPGD